MNFQSTDSYISTDELSMAVNAAISLGKPLIIKGEPGTGKTLLAFEIAKSLQMKMFTWYVKSTTIAQQGLYEYDAVARLRDAQFGDDKNKEIVHYLKPGPLWEAFESDEQVVLLIDEIDKADIEFPNVLLLELDKMEFYVYELQKTIKAKKRPIVIITSNNEKELPDAFLRRCFFHYIRFPERDTMTKIIDVHFEGLDEKLMNDAMTVFYAMRDVNGLKKKPSTSELLDWIKLLKIGKINALEANQGELLQNMPPYAGALLKNEQDFELLARIKKTFQQKKFY